MDAFYHDMHCHLDFLPDGPDIAQGVASRGSLLFVNTVEAAAFDAARTRFASCPNVRLGVGMHPWWVDDSFDADLFAEYAAQTPFVGEVGLDFGKRGHLNRQAQRAAFDAIAKTCAQQGGKLLSLHAAQAAEQVLDVLTEAGTLDSCTCIFHWYSGPSDQLKRLLDAGCYVSVNRFMLQTRRGREYVKQTPATRLLLETDELPQDARDFTDADLVAALEEAAAGVAAIKGPEALEVIAHTSEQLLAR